MREEIARIYAEEHAENPPCEACYAKADQILAPIKAKIEKVENPYAPVIQQSHHVGFERGRQAILKALD